jgi:hypothetical protein
MDAEVDARFQVAAVALVACLFYIDGCCVCVCVCLCVCVCVFFQRSKNRRWASYLMLYKRFSDIVS